MFDTKKILAVGVGRRKSAVAQVQISYGNGAFFINGKPDFNYMQENTSFLSVIKAPFDFLVLKEKILEKNYNVFVQVKGGGLSGQAEAIRLATARAFCLLEASYRPILRAKGYLTRDARSKERRKYGLKKARKAPQFSKR